MTEIITMDHPRARMVHHIRESRKRSEQRFANATWDALYRLHEGRVDVPFPGHDIAPGKSLADVMPDGAWAGRRCFIVGGGPSLKGFDFSRLKGELIIGINRAFEFVDCQILFAMDSRLHDWIMTGALGAETKARFEDYPGIKVWLGSRKHPFSPGVRVVGSAGATGMTTSISEGLCHGENSGYAALNLAVCLGASPIYLLGFDGRLAPDGRAHHHAEYPDPTTQTVLDKFVGYFNQAAPILAGRGVRVVNLNPDSAIRCFEFGNIDDIHDLGTRQIRERGFVVVSFYTTGTGYEKEVRWLQASLERYMIPHHLFPCAPAGSWRANLNNKSDCILKAFDMFPGKDIVFLDADAIVRRDPVLFDELSKRKDYDLSAHFFKYDPRSGDPDELLSGTLWIQNNETGRAIVKRWHEIGLSRPDVRHQMCLKAALEDFEKEGRDVRVFRHPFAYTCVFDYHAAKETEPVIEHFQASRRFRKDVGYGQTLKFRRDE